MSPLPTLLVDGDAEGGDVEDHEAVAGQCPLLDQFRHAVLGRLSGGLVSEAVGTNYNSHGKPTITSGNNVYVSDALYTPFGEAREFTLGPSHNSARLTYDYDPHTRRLAGTTFSAALADPQVDATRYTYDDAGNVTKSVNTRGPEGRAPVRTQCYSYDALRRLDHAWTATDNCAASPSTTEGHANIGGPTPYWTSWTFEPGGLRTTQTRHALPGTTGDTTTTYTYPANGSPRPHSLTSATTTGPSGQTLSTYDYDQSGNTTRRTLPTGEQTLTWDKGNRLDTVTSPARTPSAAGTVVRLWCSGRRLVAHAASRWMDLPDV